VVFLKFSNNILFLVNGMLEHVPESFIRSQENNQAGESKIFMRNIKKI
jgi:hypothetical protein